MLTASLERSALEADQRQQDGAASKTASSKKQGQASKDKDGVDHQATIVGAQKVGSNGSISGGLSAGSGMSACAVVDTWHWLGTGNGTVAPQRMG